MLLIFAVFILLSAFLQSYSAHPAYSVPDKKGYQYIAACRVVVGEYCVGRKDALTPDIRDAKSHSLYDSTVGLLRGDTMSNPSIFVTYHGKFWHNIDRSSIQYSTEELTASFADAQAYPEYLITFKTSGDANAC